MRKQLCTLFALSLFTLLPPASRAAGARPAGRTRAGSDVVIRQSHDVIRQSPPMSEVEYGLQRSLDRLGFTVNVPASYRGRPLLRWSDAERVSAQSDALGAEWFRGSGEVRFRVVGQQSNQVFGHALGVLPSLGRSVTLIDPVGVFRPEGRFLLSLTGGKSAKYAGKSPFRVTWTATNEVMVLPAKRGGRWVRQGANRGYWSGGTDTGAYLFCFDDSGDHDFQDLIILAQGLKPYK